MAVMRAAGVLLVVALAGCGSDRASTVSSTATAGGSAHAACETSAGDWGGTVVGAFPLTVAEVRTYMDAPQGAGEVPAAPRPGAYEYPAGWDGLEEDTPAAACYLDGPVPKGPPPAMDGTIQPSFDRRLVIVAEGVKSFMVSAGYMDNMPAQPLSRRSQ
jgi:hypothetical protein